MRSLYCVQLNCDRSADAISGPSQVPGHSTQQLDHDPVPLWRAPPHPLPGKNRSPGCAVIGAGFIPEYVWLATGGRSGVNDRVDILKNRKILVFADWLIRWKQAPDTMTLPADTTDTAGPAGTGAE